MEFRELAHDRRMQRPTLEAADLSAESVGLRGEFDVADARIEVADSIGAQGEGKLSHVWASGAALAQSELSPLELSDVRLEDADLSNARWRSVTARRVEWVNCRAMGWQATFDQVTDVYFEGCRFDYALIHVEAAKGLLVFAGCSFAEALIRGDLSRAVFIDCELAGAEFDPTNAKGCDLRGSRLAGARGLLELRGAWVDSDQASAAAERIATEAGLIVVG